MARGEQHTYTVPGLRRALNALPKEAQAELRLTANRLVTPIAEDARSRMAQGLGVAPLVARTIKAKRDREPSIAMGAAAFLPPRNGRPRARIPSQRLNAVWGGAEFGSDRFAQFGHRWTGDNEDSGLYFYAAIRAHADDVTRQYLEALDRAMADI